MDRNGRGRLKGQSVMPCCRGVHHGSGHPGHHSAGIARCLLRRRQPTMMGLSNAGAQPGFAASLELGREREECSPAVSTAFWRIARSSGTGPVNYIETRHRSTVRPGTVTLRVITGRPVNPKSVSQAAKRTLPPSSIASATRLLGRTMRQRRRRWAATLPLGTPSGGPGAPQAGRLPDMTTGPPAVAVPLPPSC